MAATLPPAPRSLSHATTASAAPDATNARVASGSHTRAERALVARARLLVRRMRAHGYARDEVVALAIALIDEVTRQLERDARSLPPGTRASD